MKSCAFSAFPRGIIERAVFTTIVGHKTNVSTQVSEGNPTKDSASGPHMNVLYFTFGFS